MSIKEMHARDNEPLSPNINFKRYHNEFNYLIHSSTVVTRYKVVSIAISYDSSVAICITKRNEEEYWIHMYSLMTNLEVFSELISGSYIKVKEVAQNEKGTKFAIVYYDDGIFKLRQFMKEKRTQEEIE